MDGRLYTEMTVEELAALSPEMRTALALKSMTELHNEVIGLRTDARHDKFIRHCLIAAVVVDLIFSALFTFGYIKINNTANTANTAAHTALSATAQIKARCEAGNAFKKSDYDNWKFVLTLAVGPVPTPQSEQTLTKALAHIAKQDAAVDCDHLKGASSK